MRVHEINDNCCEEVLAIVKKIGKYAKQIEEALDYSEFDSKKYRDDEDDEEDHRAKYKGMRYSRY